MWGRCSVTQGGVKGWSRQGRSGRRQVVGAIMAVPHGLEGLYCTSQTEACVSKLAKMNSSFKNGNITPFPLFVHSVCGYFTETVTKGGRENKVR